RRATAEILARLSEAEWARPGRHPERGEFGVETWLEVYAEHAQLHADQIRHARGRAGAPGFGVTEGEQGWGRGVAVTLARGAVRPKARAARRVDGCSSAGYGVERSTPVAGRRG